MNLFPILFAWPLAIAGSQLALSRRRNEWLVQCLQLLASGLFFIGCLLALIYQQGIVVINVANWPAPFAITLVIDDLTRIMMLVFAVVIFCISLYSLNDISLKNSYVHFYMGMWVLLLGAIGALCTYDLFNLYVWSEVILVSAFLVLVISPENNRKHIWRYAVFNISGTLFMLLAIGIIYGITGSLNNGVIAQSLASFSQPLLMTTISLLLLGICIKASIFPFYFWLPSSYPNTSSSSTLVVSSLITKVLMIAMLRLICLWQPMNVQLLQHVFIFLACCTMFFGVMGAANEFRLRDILSFHIISQIGYIFLAITIPSPFAIMAALYFLIHNIFVKTNLLMVAGIVERYTQTGDLHKLDGLLKACPPLAIIFFLSSMSLAGIPPLSGFWGKLLIFQAALNAHQYIALGVAIVVSMFTLFSMIKIWRYAFCEQSGENKSSTPSFVLMPIDLLALLPLCFIPILMGLFPEFLLSMLHHVSAQLVNPDIMQNLLIGGTR